MPVLKHVIGTAMIVLARLTQRTVSLMHAGLTAEMQAAKDGQRGFQLTVQQALAARGIGLPALLAQPGTELHPASNPKHATVYGARPTSVSQGLASGGSALANSASAAGAATEARAEMQALGSALNAVPAATKPHAEMAALRSALEVITSVTHAMAIRSRPQTAAAIPIMARATASARTSLARRSSKSTGFAQVQPAGAAAIAAQAAPAAAQAAPAAAQAAYPAAQAAAAPVPVGDVATLPAKAALPLEAALLVEAAEGPRQAAHALQELAAALAAGSIGHKLDSSAALQVCFMHMQENGIN